MPKGHTDVVPALIPGLGRFWRALEADERRQTRVRSRVSAHRYPEEVAGQSLGIMTAESRTELALRFRLRD